MNKLGLSAATSAVIVFSLMAIHPLSGLRIEVTDPWPKTLGQPIGFGFTVVIEDSELVPIGGVGVEIYNVAQSGTYRVICSNLPLSSGTTTYHTSGGDVIVTASPGSGWGYGYGYSHADWQGTEYSWGYGYGYGGYGYGYGGSGYGYGNVPTEISYSVSWISPADWPPGQYVIKVSVTADGSTFVQTKTTTMYVATAQEIRSIGFWKHQFSDNGKRHIEVDVLEYYLDLIIDESSIFDEIYPLSYQNATDYLWLKKASMLNRSVQQCLACWLNWANGAVDMRDMVDTDWDGEPDTTFGQAMAIVEDLIANGQDKHDYERAKDICDSINNMGGEQDEEDEDEQNQIDQDEQDEEDQDQDEQNQKDHDEEDQDEQNQKDHDEEDQDKQNQKDHDEEDQDKQNQEEEGEDDLEEQDQDEQNDRDKDEQNQEEDKDEPQGRGPPEDKTPPVKRGPLDYQDEPRGRGPEKGDNSQGPKKAK